MGQLLGYAFPAQPRLADLRVIPAYRLIEAQELATAELKSASRVNVLAHLCGRVLVWAARIALMGVPVRILVQLYERIQLPDGWLSELQIALEAEITARQGQAAHELQQLDRELLGLKGERRKLLAACYADASDLHLLGQEQTRISQRTSTLEVRRRSLTANLDDWRAILETAGRFATNCGAAYRYADPPTRSCSTPPSSTASSSATARSPCGGAEGI
jgi:hypothetical protein